MLIKHDLYTKLSLIKLSIINLIYKRGIIDKFTRYTILNSNFYNTSKTFIKNCADIKSYY